MRHLILTRVLLSVLIRSRILFRVFLKPPNLDFRVLAGGWAFCWTWTVPFFTNNKQKHKETYEAMRIGFKPFSEAPQLLLLLLHLFYLWVFQLRLADLLFLLIFTFAVVDETELEVHLCVQAENTKYIEDVLASLLWCLCKNEMGKKNPILIHQSMHNTPNSFIVVFLKTYLF